MFTFIGAMRNENPRTVFSPGQPTYETACMNIPKEWHLVPIATRSKNPGSLLGRGWQHQASNDPDVIRVWKDNHFGCNWGLLLGSKSGVIDVEYDSPEGQAIIDEAVEACGVQTVSYRSAKSVHRLFRYDDRFTDRKASVGVAGTEWRFGQDSAQSVIPNSIHEDGVRYEWLPGLSPDEVEIAPLPDAMWNLFLDLEHDERTRESAAVPVYEPAPLTGSSLLDRARAYVDNAEPGRPGDRNNAAFRLSGHLRTIDNLGERLSESQILDLVRLWNSRNPEPLPDKEIESVVSSSGRNGTPRDIKPPQVRVSEPSDDDRDVDLSAIMLAISGRDVFPEDCLEIPGLIGDIIKHNLATAHYPLPELALAGAIALMSSITGGKVEGLGCRSNLYVMGLAPSGGGKDHSRKINRKILLNAGHGHICGPERIGSHAGVVSALADNWNTLFQIDEIGRLLATMHSAQMSPHLYNIASVLMQVYSSADDIWQADAYGDRKKCKTLEYPHCVVYGSSVPDGFWESLTKQNLSDGLIGRFLVFEESEYVDYQQPSDAEIPGSIIDRAREWLDLKTHEGNLAGVSRHEAAHPRRLDVSEEASRRLHEHAIQISERRKQEDTVEAAIWSRHAEKTNKLALLFACSRWKPDGLIPSINYEDADKAVRLNNWLTRRMLRRSGAYVSESQVERDALRVLRIIRSKPQWTQHELTRKLRWLRPRDRRDILSDLYEADQINITKEDTDEFRRKKTFIRAV